LSKRFTLAVDLGTGSARAALVDERGAIEAIAAHEHEQIVPRFGWSEQRPEDWWRGTVAAIGEILRRVPAARGAIEMIVVCGQMHGTVLVDSDGNPVCDTAILWNDKRTVDYVANFEATHRPGDYVALSANPATPAWPAFKLQWLRDNEREAYRKAATVIMPKDFINLRLTGEIAMDRSDGSTSFLMDPVSKDWSTGMISRMGLKRDILPPLRNPVELLGTVSRRAARETGLREGTPVLVGGADYPMALYGSGVCAIGLGSEVMGSSSVITKISEDPIPHPEVCNVVTVEGQWGAFMLLESGGDAVRWSRRALFDGTASFDEMSVLAAEAPAGSSHLFFMPYLVGDRLGDCRNSRAQYFGLAAAHDRSHMHRAVLEGIAFAVKRQINILERISGAPIERVIASGGGTKDELWLRIKASVYGIPILIPKEAECGIVGCAILSALASGKFSRLDDAVAAHVSYQAEIMPDPQWQDAYRPAQSFFETLFDHSRALYGKLDALGM
jgi:xylulokinase